MPLERRVLLYAAYWLGAVLLLYGAFIGVSVLAEGFIVHHQVEGPAMPIDVDVVGTGMGRHTSIDPLLYGSIVTLGILAIGFGVNRVGARGLARQRAAAARSEAGRACPSCSRGNAADARFCQGCGRAL